MKERERERKKARAVLSLSLSLFCEEELLVRLELFGRPRKGKYENPKHSPKIFPCVLSLGGKEGKK
jgi:hypothetical protein